MSRKPTTDLPLKPLRVRVHPRTIERYQRVAQDKGINIADLHRAALERLSEAVLEQIADTLKKETR